MTSYTMVTLLALTTLILYQNTHTDISVYNQQQLFQQFKQHYNKQYTINEEQYRMEIYLQNLQVASTYNQKQGQDVFGETMFWDLTDEEFAQIYLNKQQIHIDPNTRVKPSPKNIDEIDWNNLNAVTPIRNQGSCGSCWAFSTVGVLEGYFAINTGELVELSDQQLLDCSGIIDLNYGCNGGHPFRAMRHVQRSGITTQESYPYTGIKGNCISKGGSYKVNGHSMLEQTEESLIAALSEQPVSVAVDATNWKFYKSGIFDGCDENVNHAVLAVGFNKDYYQIKNSWGFQWGMGGFIYLKRGSTCGILQEAMIVN